MLKLCSFNIDFIMSIVAVDPEQPLRNDTRVAPSALAGCIAFDIVEVILIFLMMMMLMMMLMLMMMMIMMTLIVMRCEIYHYHAMVW